MTYGYVESCHTRGRPLEVVSEAMSIDCAHGEEHAACLRARHGMPSEGCAHVSCMGVGLLAMQWRLHAMQRECWSMCGGQEKLGTARCEACHHVHRM